MRLTVNRESFLDAFSHVSGVIPARSPKPILLGTLLRADDSGAFLSATDLEVGIRHTVSGVSIGRPGSAVLPTQRIASILRTSADDELSIEAVPEGLIVRGRRAEFKLPGEDPDLFPVPAEFSAGAYHVVAAGDLKRAIRRTIVATDVESTRYALGGCLVELTADSLTMVGTDGRRLARMKTPAEAANGAEPPPGSPVVPVKALRLLERNLDENDPPVHIAWQVNGSVPSAVLVRTERAVISSRLCEGRFPTWQQVLPDRVEMSVPFAEVGPLRQCIEQASITCSEESRGIDLTFAPGVLKLNSSAADVGQTSVDVEIAYDGKPLSITFDGRYAIDMLKALDPADAIVAEFVDAKSAAVFKTADGSSLHVLMPLTRDR